MKNSNPVSAAEIQKTIESARYIEQRAIEIYKIVEGVIAAKWEGKKLNARIEKQVKEALGVPSAWVHYIREYGSSKLVISGIEPFKEYNDRLTFYLAHDSDMDGYSVAKFAQSNARHGSAAQERNAKRDAVLMLAGAVNNVAEAINQIQKHKAAVAQLEEALRAHPDGYEFVRKAG